MDLLVFDTFAHTKLEHTTASHNRPPIRRRNTYFRAKEKPDSPRLLFLTTTC
jgi:hypothetical protein